MSAREMIINIFFFLRANDASVQTTIWPIAHEHILVFPGLRKTNRSLPRLNCFKKSYKVFQEASSSSLLPKFVFPLRVIFVAPTNAWTFWRLVYQYMLIVWANAGSRIDEARSSDKWRDINQCSTFFLFLYMCLLCLEGRRWLAVEKSSISWGNISLRSCWACVKRYTRSSCVCLLIWRELRRMCSGWASSSSTGSLPEGVLKIFFFFFLNDNSYRTDLY